MIRIVVMLDTRAKPQLPAIMITNGGDLLARPPTPIEWVQWAETFFSEGMGPTRATEALARKAMELGREDPPGKRTVERLYRQWKAKSEEAQRESAFFRWPHSMLEGTIPWEASGAALELLAYWDECGRGRPTNRVVLWYYRLLLACPDLHLSFTGPGQMADIVAAELATWDYDRQAGGSFELFGGFEWGLAYKPWRSKEKDDAYQAARSREQEPIPGPWHRNDHPHAPTWESANQWLLNLIGERGFREFGFKEMQDAREAGQAEGPARREKSTDAES
jgi:hypothetical protein